MIKCILAAETFMRMSCTIHTYILWSWSIWEDCVVARVMFVAREDLTNGNIIVFIQAVVAWKKLTYSLMRISRRNPQSWINDERRPTAWIGPRSVTGGDHWAQPSSSDNHLPREFAHLHRTKPALWIVASVLYLLWCKTSAACIVEMCNN